MAGFRYIKSLGGGVTDIPRTLQMAASATIAVGDVLEFASGKLQRINAQTDTPKYLCVGLNGYQSTTNPPSVLSTATELRKIEVIPLDYGAIIETDITPTVDGTACNSNSTTTSLLVALTDGSSSDLVGGLVYVPELGETRIITANTYSSNVVTLTVAEAFRVAPTTTHTCRIVPFGFGDAAVKFHASNYHNAISTVRGDEASGHFAIYDVDLKRKTVQGYIV